MALRNILEEGDATLRKHCREVDKVNERIQMYLDDMVETMRDAAGVGLAAPQVGILRRMFVAEPQPGQLYCFVNPEIVSVEGAQENEEGCLSVPGFVGLVERPEKVTIKGLDREGKPQEYTFEGFEAIVVCHEFDHLEGILYVDKAKEMYEVHEGSEEDFAEAEDNLQKGKE